MSAKTTNPRLGRCYELAGQLVLSNPSYTLVHGKIYNPFGRGYPEIDHAWVVTNAGEVLDLVMDNAWDKNLYYNIFKAVEHRCYTHQEILTATTQSGHWGPWPEI